MSTDTKTSVVEPVKVALKLSDVSKHFGLVKANDLIDLTIKSGHIHGIIGENGAGKSTLMSIIYGFYEADCGLIHVNDKLVQIRSSEQAIALGIGMVHQHFMLVNDFTVLENVLLGVEGGPILKQGERQARKKLMDLASEYSLDVPLNEVISNLSVGIQQRVEILKALYRGAQILILDEPTGVLTPQEADDLFRVLNFLKENGVTILLITHKLREIMAVTDEVSVMRQGKMIAHRKTSETNKAELAELMVGRKVRLDIDKADIKLGNVVLDVKNLNVSDSRGIPRVKDISFQLSEGEIVGIAGVSGNGQSELLQALSGIIPFKSGSITYSDRKATANNLLSPAKLREMKVAHVPEDRQKMGLILSFKAYKSAILGYQKSPSYNNGMFLNTQKMLAEYKDRAKKFDVRPPSPYIKSANFSGGNQQKIVLARELEAEPDVLLIGQPTRGVDIGAIELIHKQIMDMRNAGKAVLLVSVELEEIMALSDRILVMCNGKITGEIEAEKSNEQILGLMMANATTSSPPKQEVKS